MKDYARSILDWLVRVGGLVWSWVRQPWAKGRSAVKEKVQESVKIRWPNGAELYYSKQSERER